jgi:hypothetical protein
MSARMIRVRVRDEKANEVEKAVGEMFTAIEAAQPQGVHYASCKLQDGVTYLILLALDNDGENPLEAIPAFRDFQTALPAWLAEPPAMEALTPVGSYRVF